MNQRPGSHINLRRLNQLLSIVVVSLALYVIIVPLLPQLTFKLNDTLNIQPPLVEAGAGADKSSYPSINTLVIPSINLQQQVHDGPSEAVLMRGLWHRPHTSSPDNDSNTVIAGHRFTYSDPGVFYHLDKVKQADEIILYWNKEKYVYKVDTIKEVPPTEVEIEEPSKEPTLTLYTCTPLWTSKNRLVVQASLIGADQ